MTPFIADLIIKIIELVGPAVVRAHVDQWEVQRKAADVAEDAKFGPKP